MYLFGIGLEGHLSLGNISGRRMNTINVESSQLEAVLGHGSLPLKLLDGDKAVIAGGSGEDPVWLQHGVPAFLHSRFVKLVK